MEGLEHLRGECTGTWRLVPAPEGRLIRCDMCAVMYPATPDNRSAAIAENYAGIQLCRLTPDHCRELDGRGRPV